MLLGIREKEDNMQINWEENNGQKSLGEIQKEIYVSLYSFQVTLPKEEIFIFSSVFIFVYQSAFIFGVQIGS